MEGHCRILIKCARLCPVRKQETEVTSHNSSTIKSTLYHRHQAVL